MADVSRTYEEKIAAIIENLYGDKEVVGETADFDNDKEPGIIDRLGGVASPLMKTIQRTTASGAAMSGL